MKLSRHYSCPDNGRVLTAVCNLRYKICYTDCDDDSSFPRNCVGTLDYGAAEMAADSGGDQKWQTPKLMTTKSKMYIYKQKYSYNEGSLPIVVSKPRSLSFSPIRSPFPRSQEAAS